MQMTAISQLIGDALDGTKPSHADVTFRLDLGELTFVIVHPCPEHTPGGSFVWVPEHDTIFTCDIAYVERILGVDDQSSTTNCLPPSKRWRRPARRMSSPAMAMPRRWVVRAQTPMTIW